MYPNLGEGMDGQAIKKHLKIFEKKSSKKKYISVTGKSLFFINQYISEMDLGHM